MAAELLDAVLHHGIDGGAGNVELARQRRDIGVQHTGDGLLDLEFADIGDGLDRDIAADRARGQFVSALRPGLRPHEREQADRCFQERFCGHFWLSLWRERRAARSKLL
jgi:hypothetical protein